VTTRRAERRPARTGAKVLPEDVRRHNRALVLQTLFDSGPASRADLARATGLTRVTVSDLVAELLAEDLVTELGARPGTRVGKPATLVGLRHDACQVVAVDLSEPDRFHGAVTDLAGAIGVRASLDLRGRTGADAVALVEELVRGLVAQAHRPVLGVGVASPGLVDDDGVVLQAPNLGWHAVPLARVLGERLDLPVHVANDANTAVMGEYTFGQSASHALMLVRVGRGLGAGLVLDGQLLAGQHLAAGEIGHLVVDAEGAPCACGRRGCLETVLSVPSLQAALAGLDDDAAQEALARAGRALGVALAPVLSALDLREVVLSGPAELIDGPLTGAALKVLRERCMPVVGEDVRLRMPTHGDDVVLAGAAGLVLSGQLGVS
jgi:predicted NBD/HSP70 family sugar kinase